MNWNIYNEDAVGWANNYKGELFHALFTDAPYHLESIVKRFGKTSTKDKTKTSEKVRNGSDGYSRLIGTGFMGQKWDGGDLAFRPETWKSFKEVLHPGAFCMAFSAARNWHRMAVAIEDAGFVLHPTIFLWAYSQGFPKATNISKQLDENQEVWDGHRYGLQALKPAVEPIVVFQKPYEGRPIENIVETGAGALNIKRGRIPSKEPVVINRFKNGSKPWGGAKGEDFDTVLSKQGRYPSNLILTEDSSNSINEQSGILKSGKMTPKNKRHTDGSPNGIYGKFDVNAPLTETIGDSGGASRFFYRVREQLEENDPVYYCAKVSPKERNAGLSERNVHPTLKPLDLCKYLSTLLLPPVEYAPRRIFIPFSGVGSEMIGAGKAGWEEIVGVEFDKENGYIDVANKRLDYWLRS